MSLLVEHFSTVNRERLSRFNDQGWKPVDWFMALYGEAGELAGAVKRVRRYDEGISTHWNPDKDGAARPVLVQGVLAEMADVLIYLDLLAAYTESTAWWIDDATVDALCDRARIYYGGILTDAQIILEHARSMGLAADRLQRSGIVGPALLHDIAVITVAIGRLYADEADIEQALVDKFNLVSDTRGWPERIEVEA